MTGSKLFRGLAAALFAAAPMAALAGPPRPPLPPPPPLPHVSVRVVPSPPPPPRHVVVVERPGPRYVWQDGYWDYGGSGYAWVDGRWVLPPHRHAHWVRARYVRLRHGRGWEYVPAHWSNQRVIWEKHYRY